MNKYINKISLFLVARKRTQGLLPEKVNGLVLTLHAQGHLHRHLGPRVGFLVDPRVLNCGLLCAKFDLFCLFLYGL